MYVYYVDPVMSKSQKQLTSKQIRNKRCSYHLYGVRAYIVTVSYRRSTRIRYQKNYI